MARGDHFEDQALRWLREQGWRPIQRNARFRGGEIDLIALDGEQLVFIEVRARSNHRFPGAAASVDRRKQQRLLRAAAAFLQRHPQWAAYPCRFDVIAFEPRQSAAPAQPTWIRAAFTA